MAKRDRIKVVVKKLGRSKAWGQADVDTRTIEIDPRAVGKKKMEIFIHEGLHLMFPMIDEEFVKRGGAEITRLLWDHGFRPTEFADHQKLQDEIK